MTGKAYVQTDSGELVHLDILDSGLDFGPSQVESRSTLTNYEATMTFETDFIAPRDTWLSLAYTPADELRDRLNQRLKGEEPWSVINTRYWMGL